MLKLSIWVYLSTEFQFSSIILICFRQGVGCGGTPRNRPLKSPSRLGLIETNKTIIQVTNFGPSRKRMAIPSECWCFILLNKKNKCLFMFEIIDSRCYWFFVSESALRRNYLMLRNVWFIFLLIWYRNVFYCSVIVRQPCLEFLYILYIIIILYYPLVLLSLMFAEDVNHVGKKLFGLWLYVISTVTNCQKTFKIQSGPLTSHSEKVIYL